MSVTTYTWNGTTWTNGTPTGTNDTMYVMAGTTLYASSGALFTGNTLFADGPATMVVFTDDTLAANSMTLSAGDTLTIQGSASLLTNGTVVTTSTILADTYNFGSNDVVSLIDTQIAGPLDANGKQTAGTTLNFQNGDTLNLVSTLPGATGFDMGGHGGNPTTSSLLSLTAANASLLITDSGWVFDNAMNFFASPGGITTIDVLQNGTSSSFLQVASALVESGGTLVVNSGTTTATEFANAGFLLVSGGTASALVQLNAVMDSHAGEMDILGGQYGATLEVNTAIGGGQAIVFDGTNGALQIDASNKLSNKGSTSVLANFKARVEGFQVGDTILLAGVAPGSGKEFSWSYGTDSTYGSGVLELFKISNGTTTLAGVVRLAGSTFAASSGTLASGGTASAGDFVFTTVGTNVAITLQSTTSADWLGGSGDWNTGTLWSATLAPGGTQAAEIAMTTAEAAAILGGTFSPYVVSVTGSESAASLALADPLATLAVSGTLTLASSLQQTEGVLEILSGGTLTATRYQQVNNDFTLAAGGTLNLTGAAPFSTGIGQQGLNLGGGGTIEGVLNAHGATFIGEQSGAYVQATGTAASVTDTYAMIGGGNFADSGGEQASLQIAGPGVTWIDAGGDATTPYSGAMLVGGGYTSVQNTLNASGQFPTVVNGGGNGNLRVDNSATLTDATYAILGVTNGSNGYASVTNGALWSIHPSSAVAIPGSIVIGATTLYATSNPGEELPALMVGGQGNGNLYIGNNGSLVSSGTVLVGAVDAPNSLTMAIGVGTGSVGSVVVDGPNALLSTEGGVLSIGNKSAGTLSVNNGGTVLTGIQNAGSTGIAFGTVVGNKSGGNGQLSISGNGNATSLFEVQSGDLVIGRSGQGQADVNSYGSLSVVSGTIWLGGVNATNPGGGGGQLNVNDGTVQAAGLAFVFPGTSGAVSQLTVNGGLISLANALNLDGGNATIGGSTNGSGVVSLGSNGTATLGGNISLLINTAGTLLLANGYTGNNLVGRLTLGDANGNGQIFVAGGTLLDAGGLLLGLTMSGGTPTPTTGFATLQLSGGSFVQAGGMGIAPSSVVTVDASSTLLLGSTGFGSGAGILIGSDGTLIGDGLVDASSNIVDNGTIIAYGGGTLQLTGLVSGTGTLALDAGAGLNLSAGVTGTNIIFGTGTAETLALADPSAFSAPTVAGFGAGDTIDLQNQVASSETFTQTSGTAGLLNIYSGTTLLESYTLAGNYTSSQFQLQTDAAGTGTYVIGEAACFAKGTRIATAKGDIAVERLTVGDRVRLARGGSAEVVWLGHRTVECARHPRPHDVLPVRVLAHAFGPGRPRRDLLLSPDHAVFQDGVLIPVRYLVNDATIAQGKVASVTYWHVELARHDVLLAENLPAESYLDTGNRGAFENGDGPTMLHADFALKVWEREACARLVREGAELEAARSWLLARAESLGHARTGNADLRILADGVELEPQVAGNEFWVALPDGARRVRLVSRSAVPAHVHDSIDDCRRLGVAVAALAIDDEPVALADARLARGWQEVEDAASWRWTDGDAEILACGGRVLSFTLAMTTHYWQEQRTESARVA